MNAILTVTETYSDGHVTRAVLEWAGWDVDAAAKHRRTRLINADRNVTGTGRTYTIHCMPRETGVYRVTEHHEWSDPDQPSLNLKEMK